MFDPWSHLYNKLYEYYNNLCVDEFISEEEMENCIDEIEGETSFALWERCLELEVPVSRDAQPDLVEP